MKFILSIILAFLFALSCFGQRGVGSIEVTTTDETAALVPNTSLTIESSRKNKNNIPNFRKTLTTNENGFQRIPEIPIGNYKITFTAAGFEKKELVNIKVVSDKVTSFEVRLVSLPNPLITTTTSSSIPNGKVAVYIYGSPAKAVFGLLKPSVFIDEKEIAEISPSRYMLAIVNPGRHKIHFNNSNPNHSVEANFELGQIYYLRINWEKGKRLKPKKIDIVSKEKASINQLKKIDDYDVIDKSAVITRSEG